jgi:hypothetical protein
MDECSSFSTSCQHVLSPDDYLIMENDGFDVLLDLFCKNFIEYFCISIHKWNWFEVLFFVGGESLCSLGIKMIVAF